MENSNSIVKIRYAETDQMGVVHHGNYPQYFEIARIDWLERLGISYASMEKDGVMLPVYSMNIKYNAPLYFGNEINIEVRLREAPNVKIIFDYTIYNEQGKKCCEASTILVFMNSMTRKPIKCPQFILDKL
ncbi:thioesterase family protein [Gramella sp. AN32]|uniref:Acyl-CoA thioesterase n=1 Tax=Christiangramia antarctica TaxID=2058158 RepID=A0ABW5X563_9FLAO|nr:thioesterase family protein [Gramella sp. AN32]MCM4157903.1 thioesterase [Gramella sp. AN32]